MRHAIQSGLRASVNVRTGQDVSTFGPSASGRGCLRLCRSRRAGHEQIPAEPSAEGEPDENIVRIDLDGNKISNNFQIKPYSFGHMGKESLEFEEQIITKKDGLPINYITNIKVIINDEDEYSYTYFDSLIKKIQEKNIPYEIQ